MNTSATQVARMPAAVQPPSAATPKSDVRDVVSFAGVLASADTETADRPGPTADTVKTERADRTEGGASSVRRPVDSVDQSNTAESVEKEGGVAPDRPESATAAPADDAVADGTVQDAGETDADTADPVLSTGQGSAVSSVAQQTTGTAVVLSGTQVLTQQQPASPVAEGPAPGSSVREVSGVSVTGVGLDASSAATAQPGLPGSAEGKPAQVGSLPAVSPAPPPDAFVQGQQGTFSAVSSFASLEPSPTAALERRNDGQDAPAAGPATTPPTSFLPHAQAQHTAHPLFNVENVTLPAAVGRGVDGQLLFGGFSSGVSTAEMTVDLSDEGLGKLTVSAAAAADGLHLKLTTTDIALRDMLKERGADLRREFEQSGTQLGSFDVSTRGERHPQQSPTEGSRTSDSTPRAGVLVPQTQAKSRGAVRPVVDTSSVDVWI